MMPYLYKYHQLFKCLLLSVLIEADMTSTHDVAVYTTDRPSPTDPPPPPFNSALSVLTLGKKKEKRKRKSLTLPRPGPSRALATTKFTVQRVSQPATNLRPSDPFIPPRPAPPLTPPPALPFTPPLLHFAVAGTCQTDRHHGRSRRWTRRSLQISRSTCKASEA